MVKINSWLAGILGVGHTLGGTFLLLRELGFFFEELGFDYNPEFDYGPPPESMDLWLLLFGVIQLFIGISLTRTAIKYLKLKVEEHYE